MQFREAWFHLLNGEKIRRPHWSGFWSWEGNTIMMYCQDGKVLDIRQTDNPAYTFDNVAANDWEIAVLADAKKEPTELKDTVAGMHSQDYKERFKAEYYQVVIRFKKLVAMLEKWDKGKLTFTPTCPRGIYNFQIRSMADYIAVLEARAMIEGIELNS